MSNLNFRVLCLFNKGKINKEKLKDFYAQFKEKFDNYVKKEILFSTLLEAILPTQGFLIKKLNLKDGIGILDDNYLDLWGNRDNDDFLDEMTVILQSKRRVASGKVVYIGESTFLQEYYHDDSIVSWSHYSVDLIDFWKQTPIILEKIYVSKVIEKFGLKKINLLKVYNRAKEKCIFRVFKIKRSDSKKIEKIVQTYINTNKEKTKTIVVIVKIQGVSSEIFVKRFTLQKEGKIKLLPKYMTFPLK